MFTIFALAVAAVLAGLIIGLDYFSAPEEIKEEIKDDLRKISSWSRGPFEDLSETTGQEEEVSSLPAMASVNIKPRSDRQKKLSGSKLGKRARRNCYIP